MGEVFASLARILIASFAMVVITWFALRPLALIFSLETFIGVFLQTAAATLFGLLVYFFVNFLFKTPELKGLASSIFKKSSSKIHPV